MGHSLCVFIYMILYLYIVHLNTLSTYLVSTLTSRFSNIVEGFKPTTFYSYKLSNSVLSSVQTAKPLSLRASANKSCQSKSCSVFLINDLN